MKKLIITADDYGMSKAVNDAIDAGIAAGLITTTNVMTNMPYYEEAVKLYPATASIIDASVAKGVYHKNTAANKKSGLQKRINALKK